jgi:hypothetical protein
MQMDMRGRGTLGSLRYDQSWPVTFGGPYALDGTRETLVLLGIVVLETDLELDSLHKVTSFLAICFS